MSATHDRPEDTGAGAVTGSRNRRVALVCAAIAFGMVGLAYASVPLYTLFCQVTGYGGTPQRAERPASRDPTARTCWRVWRRSDRTNRSAIHPVPSTPQPRAGAASEGGVRAAGRVLGKLGMGWVGAGQVAGGSRAGGSTPSWRMSA